LEFAAGESGERLGWKDRKRMKVGRSIRLYRQSSHSTGSFKTKESCACDKRPKGRSLGKITRRLKGDPIFGSLKPFSFNDLLNPLAGVRKFQLFSVGSGGNLGRCTFEKILTEAPYSWNLKARKC